jgi:hypothetical protein
MDPILSVEPEHRPVRPLTSAEAREVPSAIDQRRTHLFVDPIELPLRPRRGHASIRRYAFMKFN